MIKQFLIGGAAALATLPAIATAQVAVVARPVVAASGTLLPSNTEILLTANTEVSSKSVREGDTFALSVARDVMLGDMVVIPRGTRANARVSWRTGKGAFGKSAKFEFDVTDLDLNGRSVPVSGHYRIEGQGNTGAAVGAAVAVGVFGAFVTGRSAVVGQGSEWKAFTKEPLAVTLAGGTTTPDTVASAGN